MHIEIIEEAGVNSALKGLSLSYNAMEGDMRHVALKLYDKDGGHNKFLESMVMWININAPRYWWQQFDTYRIGVTKQSESTMHTILKKPLCKDNFEDDLPKETMDRLNSLISEKKFDQLKNELPEGFLQRRIVCTNYKTLRNIIAQRKNHKIVQWRQFCDMITHTCKHGRFLID